METFSALLALCAGNSPVNSPHKDQWRGALMFSFICAGTNGWVNNVEAGDLRRHRAHYDVIVMWTNLTHASNNKWEWMFSLSSCSANDLAVRKKEEQCGFFFDHVLYDVTTNYVWWMVILPSHMGFPTVLWQNTSNAISLSQWFVANINSLTDWGHTQIILQCCHSVIHPKHWQCTEKSFRQMCFKYRTYIVTPTLSLLFTNKWWYLSILIFFFYFILSHTNLSCTSFVLTAQSSSFGDNLVVDINILWSIDGGGDNDDDLHTS